LSTYFMIKEISNNISEVHHSFFAWLEKE